MINPHHLAQGARNLLLDCAGLEPDMSVLILHEDPQLGWYDLQAPQAVAEQARHLGMRVSLMPVGAPGQSLEANVSTAMQQHDCIVFFARIGDQSRFEQPPTSQRRVMCYIRDAAMLASDYGRTPYRCMRELLQAIDGILSRASSIEIRCPLGTEFIGRMDTGLPVTDVSILRFPLGVHCPIAAAGFSGRVALAHYLTPTGSRVYEPAWLELEQLVYARVENGRIMGFVGQTEQVNHVQRHYHQVAEQFDLQWDNVHSWHTGFHPGCAYPTEVAANPDRWSNTVFTHPRCLHFHTCGQYAPAEICWMVLDHSVAVDGILLWHRGRLRPENFASTAQCLATRTELSTLFARPTNTIGFGL